MEQQTMEQQTTTMEQDQDNKMIPSYKNLKMTLKEIDEELYSKFKKDTLFKHTNDRENEFYVRKNQLKTCKKIVILMLLSKIDPENFKQAYILFAEMQTGKSGIFTNVCFIVFRNNWIREKLGLKYLLILTPMNDSDFLSQLKKDVDQRLGGIAYFSNHAEYKFVGMNTDGENGFRGKELKALIQQGHFIQDTFVVVDEVHYGNDANQSLQKLFQQQIGISNSASSESLREKNIYLLGVSATPYSEIVSIKEFERKFLIQHRTPSSYYGIKKHMLREKVKQSFPLNSAENIQKFVDVVEEFRNQKTYIIARIRNSGKETDRCEKVKQVLESKFQNAIVKIIDESLPKKERDFKLLTSNEPSTLTIYLIKNMLSAGKRIEKTYISVVFEHMATARSYNETIVQSLIGRICGYSQHDIICYTDLKHAQDYIDVVDSRFKIMPQKGKNYHLNTKKGSGIRKLYMETQPERWPKTTQECNDLVKMDGEIGMELASHGIISQRFIDSKELENRVKRNENGDLVLQPYRIGHSDPKVWDVSNLEGLEDFKQKLVGHGSISSIRPKMRYPVLFHGEIIYAIAYFGGINESNIYETHTRASSHIIHDEFTSSSSSSEESSSEEENPREEIPRRINNGKEIQSDDEEQAEEEGLAIRIDSATIDPSKLKTGRKGKHNQCYSVLELRNICKSIGVNTTHKGKCIKKEELIEKIKQYYHL
jgi:hypothetical protein